MLRRKGTQQQSDPSSVLGVRHADTRRKNNPPTGVAPTYEVREPQPQLALFGETPLPADQQIEFYQHEVGWANCLILGDSLLVMNSLLVKEGMAGKVRMIYIGPPYGMKYASNFQPRIDRRDVKDKDEDLTREPDQIKAYWEIWRLGISGVETSDGYK